MTIPAVSNEEIIAYYCKNADDPHKLVHCAEYFDMSVTAVKTRVTRMRARGEMASAPRYTPKGARTYPWAPVEEFIRYKWPTVNDNMTTSGPGRFANEPMPKPRLYELIGLSNPRYYRYHSAGCVSEYVADEIATRLGVHPVLLWPTWFDDALEDIEQAS